MAPPSEIGLIRPWISTTESVILHYHLLISHYQLLIISHYPLMISHYQMIDKKIDDKNYINVIYSVYPKLC